MNVQTFAQNLILGKIDDHDGQPVPSATVQLVSSTSGEKRVTGASPEGEFQFANIDSGRYLLFVSSVGFTDYSDTIKIGRASCRERVYVLV